MRMSEEEYQQVLSRMGKKSSGRPPPSPSRAASQRNAAKEPKYHNRKVYIYEDGYTSTGKSNAHEKLIEHFDSVKEYNRCEELRLLEKSGAIRDLKTQYTVMIQPGFTDAAGERIRAITYRADFAYLEDGKQIIEDVKAFDKKRQKYRLTEAFKLKWKLMKAKYPEFVFRLY